MKMKRQSKAKRIIKITALSLAGFLLAGVISAAAVLYGRASTMMSAKRVGEQLCTVNYRQSYHLTAADY